MKYILDSSFLLSLYMVEDVNHDKSLGIFCGLDLHNDILYINEITYIELLTVLTYKKGLKSIPDMKNILRDAGVVMIHSGNMEYVRYHEYIAKKISVVDVSILYDALKNNCEILSFDKDLLKSI